MESDRHREGQARSRVVRQWRTQPDQWSSIVMIRRTHRRRFRLLDARRAEVWCSSCVFLVRTCDASFALLLDLHLGHGRLRRIAAEEWQRGWSGWDEDRCGSGEDGLLYRTRHVGILCLMGGILLSVC